MEDFWGNVWRVFVKNLLLQYTIEVVHHSRAIRGLKMKRNQNNKI